MSLRDSALPGLAETRVYPSVNVDSAAIEEHEPLTGVNAWAAAESAAAIGVPQGRPDVTLSVVMPVYNESATVLAAVYRVLSVPFPCPVELIVVDDGSTDGTGGLLDGLHHSWLTVLHHPENRGKGAAVRSGAEAAGGSHLLVLDADLEYSPYDIPKMLEPVMQRRTDHVFGARIFGFHSRFPSFRYAVGGRATTLAANLIFDSMLTDLHTCLKLVPTTHFRALPLSEEGFGLDTEITARLLRRGVRPYEVPVSYVGRSKEEGKKITWRDGVECLQVLTRARREKNPKPLPAITSDLSRFGYQPDAVPVELPAQPARGKLTTPPEPKRLHFCVVGPDFHFLSGLSVYTCRLANAMVDRHQVTAMLLRRLIPERMYPGAARTGKDLTSLTYDERVKSTASIDWYWADRMPAALKFLREERPDVLVLQWWTAAALHTYLALAIAAKRLNIPVVIEFHEVQDPGEAAMPLASAYSRRGLPALLARASGALVHNDHDLELLRRTYGRQRFDRLDVEIAPHGPYDHLPATTELQAVDDGVTRLLFFGLIRPYKGLEDLITAFNRLSAEDASHFCLTVVGETWEDWDEPARLIRNSPHGDRIEFVNRYVSDAEAGTFFARSDALVLPYRRGSASGPLQIAMSAGLPVVLYAVGGLVEAVADYEGAVLVRPNDVSALQQALLDLRERRSHRFVSSHSWDTTVDAFQRLAAAVAP